MAFEVHGHLVASDVFGDGYVIPILDTLEDIKQQFNATLVDLPSALDVKFMPRPGQQSGNNTHQQVRRSFVSSLWTAVEVIKVLTHYSRPVKTRKEAIQVSSRLPLHAGSLQNLTLSGDLATPATYQ